MIVAVSPGVAETYRDRIRAISPEIELVWPTDDGGWSGDVQAAEVVYFSEDFWTGGYWRERLPQLFSIANLRWFHTFSAGVDHPAFRAVLEQGAILTNAAGTTAEPIAQYVLAMMLRIVKRIDSWAQAQRERRWEPLDTEELTGKTVGVVGVGHIGGEVARLAKAFRMQVIGCRRRQRAPRNVDELVPPERLAGLLQRSDFVVLALPLSSATEGLIGKPELRAMKDAAWLINVSRGRIVQQDELIQALKAGSIAGACLDVFQEEPLEEASELWSLPNVMISPHNAGWSPLNLERGTELFLDNLERFVSGRAMRNRVRANDI